MFVEEERVSVLFWNESIVLFGFLIIKKIVCFGTGSKRKDSPSYILAITQN